MVVQDRRGGAAAAVGVACGTGLAVGLLTTGCSTVGAAANDQASPARVATASAHASPGRDGATSGHASSASPGRDAADEVRHSADALVRAGSATVRTAMETASGGTRVAIRGTGRYDFRSGTGELVLVLPDPAGTSSGGHRPITEILAPGALYMKNRGAGVPADKWVRVDTGSLADGNLVTGGATDPLAAAELLRGARDVTYEGKERLDGVPVRHYRGVTDIGRAAGHASGRTRSALAAAEKGFTTDAVPFDAYLDEKGRLRKVRQRFHFANGVPKGTSVTSTTELSGFGAETVVRVPDEPDIYTGKIASAKQ
ncbi:hypothetical protein [Streptomyces halobius]|uniref:Lipoprotein n=1 Tax=Streptomyces halobius TaxID=2879846 RepID=A0ABY4M7X5_9ACTN|nr:hypothetical protein [Streptomyces halobius]UQA93876.1 hypothetical protein K9S39_20145 [Streptomyces halobius]